MAFSFTHPPCRLAVFIFAEHGREEVAANMQTNPETNAETGRRVRRFAGMCVGTIVCAAATHLAIGCAPNPHSAPTGDADHAHFPAEVGIVAIRKPAGPPTIKTDVVDHKGQPVTLACANCHATKPANAQAKLGHPLELFHQSLQGAHASLTCISCHNAADGYATLRLADGKSLPYPEVMTLCAQCHGPQYRDYVHGAHGGMTGHWDRSKGGRVRNNCVDCHDPHAPKYPIVVPARGPNDRFQNGDKHE
jgi:hypothetical protein